MSCSISIYPDNSLVFETTLTNPNESPIYVNDAAVSLTVYDMLDVELPSQAWPLSLSYVTASDGIYQAVVLSLVDLVVGTEYKVIVTALGTDSLEGSWTYYVRATERGCS